MAENRAPGDPTPLGADLAIPALALGFAAYFFVSIVDLNWEAKANGVLIGSILAALTVVQIGRVALAIRRGEASLGVERIVGSSGLFGRRLALISACTAFIALMPWLGLTLGVFLAAASMLYALDVRRPGPLFLIPLGLAVAAYAMFVLLLNTAFPHGPIEKLLGLLR